MKSIIVKAIANDGEVHKMEVSSSSASLVLLKFRGAFKKYLKELERIKQEQNIEYIEKEFTFQGWDYRGYKLLKPLTQQLDKQNIVWWIEP